MSLINDALKRAESEKRAAHSSAPLQPVESAPSHSTSPLLLVGIFLLGIGAIAIAAALWFGGAKTQVAQTAPPPGSTPAPEPDTTKAVAAAPTNRAPQTAPAPSTVATTPPVSSTRTSAPLLAASNSHQATATSLPSTTPSTTLTKTAATSPAVTPTQQSVRLQSIFYRLRNPTVIINGKTLGVGDTLDGIKVVSIQRTSVEIVQNGKYRTLTLQD